MTATAIDYTARDWPLDVLGDPDAPQWHGPLSAEEQAEQDRWAAENAAMGYDTPEYLAFEVASYAEAIGAATTLVRCYLCHLDATGTPDHTPDSHLSPLRGVLEERTVRASRHPEAEVYTVQHLTCGHGII